MTSIISNATLVNMPANWWPTSYGSLTLYDGFSKDYATLYKEQPNVRTCVDFLARNIAQLGIHVYRKDAKLGRLRLNDHPLAELLNRPMPGVIKISRYRLIESLVADLGVFANAYWHKETIDGKLIGLMRLPPTSVKVKGVLYPTEYEVTLSSRPQTYSPEEIIHFRGYNAESAVNGLSPLETLRRVLAEEHAAGDYREHFWQNAARQSGIITRPKDAGVWSDQARQRFKKEWQSLYTGSDNSGKTAILEEGMDWKSISFNPKDSEYLLGRKLTREECARAYHIPPPLVGILDHATYSNITEQHKSLYTDVLGPWLAMIEEDIMLQLVPDFEDKKGIYIEFNIQEKMQGDFETQTRSLQSATGAPWMTVNEARQVMNLPTIEGADELVVPLNVLMGGQASPTDSAPKGQRPKSLSTSLITQGDDVGLEAPQLEIASSLAMTKEPEMESFDTREPGLREVYNERWRSLLVKTLERQRNAIMPQVGDPKNKIASSLAMTKELWDEERWNREVSADFTELSQDTALAWAQALGKKMGVTVTAEEVEKFCEESARIAAENLNESTREQVEEALADEDPKSAMQKVFEMLLAVAVVRFALGRVTSLSQYGAYKAAVKGRITTKTWVVNSMNPRDAHAHMNGETVGLYEKFSNGLRWPGDYEGSAAQTVNCQCSLRYNREVMS
jgi:HK97 family phage portal protein